MATRLWILLGLFCFSDGLRVNFSTRQYSLE